MPITRIVFCAIVALLSPTCLYAVAHEGHVHDLSTTESVENSAAVDLAVAENSYTAKGKTYRWKHRPDLGKQSDALIKAAKGGLHNSADQDLATNEIVTVVARHGLVALDFELKEWKLVEGQDPVFAAGMNAHGADCFLLEGQSYWVFASTNTQEVVVSQRGNIVAKLYQPQGTEFDNPTVNEYFKSGGKFTPCDVVYLPVAKRLVVVTGYAPGDFALTAGLVDGQWQWGGAAWGGRENIGGMLNTGHGVEVATDGGKEIVEIASRSHGRLFAFTPGGAQIRMPGAEKDFFLALPKGSTPCDISRVGPHMFVPLLNGQPKSNSPSAVLVMDGGNPVGRLTPATHDTLSHMLHMHGFCPVEKDGKLYGVVLSWRNGRQNKEGQLNDGRIEIFEAVEQDAATSATE